MEPAPIRILSRAAFDLMLLSTGRHWVASIREQEADPIPRPEFFGHRINLAFYDLTDGPNIATAAHVERVYRFSQRWAKRMFEKSWQIKTHGTRTRVRPSCLEAGMGNKVGEI